MKQPSPSVTTTRLFRNGNSQAVRIPKALAFDSVDIEVEIERRGDELIVRPAKQKLTGLGAAFRKIGPQFQGFRRDPGAVSTTARQPPTRSRWALFW